MSNPAVDPAAYDFRDYLKRSQIEPRKLKPWERQYLRPYIGDTRADWEDDVRRDATEMTKRIFAHKPLTPRVERGVVEKIVRMILRVRPER